MHGLGLSKANSHSRSQSIPNSSNSKSTFSSRTESHLKMGMPSGSRNGAGRHAQAQNRLSHKPHMSTSTFHSDELGSDDPVFQQIVQRTSQSQNVDFDFTNDEDDFDNEGFEKYDSTKFTNLERTYSARASTSTLVSSNRTSSSTNTLINDSYDDFTQYENLDFEDYPQYDQEEDDLDFDLQSLERKLAEAANNISAIKADLDSLKRQTEKKENELGNEIERMEKAKKHIAMAKSNALTKGKGKGKAVAGGIVGDLGISEAGDLGAVVVRGHNPKTDYFSSFSWEKDLLPNAMKKFGIKEFRLCQRGVINAALEGRDIVVVMPTGGGKSLTYQLPAILTSGVTLVISPLLSLISDQVYHMREIDVEAVKQTGSTSKSEQDAINARLGWMVGLGIPKDGLGLNNSAASEGGKKEINLLYCTPEKISKSKRFQGILQRLADVKRLTRIVIDEAHCVSQLGHDFRPDYQKLHILRQLFPKVPIMALSATCPPLVLKDLLKILGLKGTVSGDAADSTSTVYFTSPLYRPNLHYQVLPKPADSNKVFDEMTKWILKEHRNDSGIVYCLSKKDTEKVATELRKRGNIQTGVYHADRTDKEKEDLHGNWQKGKIKVVCATIAFGLGIDKGDVRFVIHHSISKSLDGFYQESGRAGRDGKDSDCILYYRAQDASTLSTMSMTDKDGASKLHAMLTFAQDLKQCRKIQFANYFSHSSNLSITSWSTSDLSAREPCGHCDNCTRPPDSFQWKDVTVEAWQLLKIVEHVHREAGNVTLAQVVELARSTGKGTFAAGGGGGGRKRGRNIGGWGGKEQVELDLDVVCGGKVEMKKEDVETLLVELLLKRYLREQFHSTAYATIAYIQPGECAARLTRFSDKDSLKDLPDGSKIFCGIRTKVKVTKSTTTKKSTKSTAKASGSATTTAKSSKGKGKGKAAHSTSISGNDDNGPDFDSDIDDQEDDEEMEMDFPAASSKRKPSRKGERNSSSWILRSKSKSQPEEIAVVEISDSDEDEKVQSTLREEDEYRTDELDGDDSDEEVGGDQWKDVSKAEPLRKRRRTEELEKEEESQGIYYVNSSPPPRN